MIRIFQFVLLGVICFYTAVLSLFIIGNVFWWNADNPAENEVNNAQWNYAYRLGAVKLTRQSSKDSTTQKNHLLSYVSIQNASPDSSENGRYYVYNKLNQKVFVDFNFNDTEITLPISFSQYSKIKIFAVIFLAICVGMLVWVTILLYQFTGAARRQHFFTVPNMRKLKTVGWIVLICGTIGYVGKIILPSLLSGLLNYKSISSLTNAGNLQFPSLLMGGMILLIVAKAFENGIKMKEDEEFTA